MDVKEAEHAVSQTKFGPVRGSSIWLSGSTFALSFSVLDKGVPMHLRTVANACSVP